jgi:thymidylate synthase
LELQLSREPRELPKMILNPKVKNIFDFTFEDFTLEGYKPYPYIKGAVAI